jgi:hypothetical protein
MLGPAALAMFHFEENSISIYDPLRTAYDVAVIEKTWNVFAAAKLEFKVSVTENCELANSKKCKRIARNIVNIGTVVFSL